MIPSRRRFLAQGACAAACTLAACAGAGATRPGDTAPGAPGPDTPPPPDDPCVPAPFGDAGDFLSFEAHPALSAAGGSVEVSLGGAAFRVARVTADCSVAVSAVCTHQGCALGYDAGRFVCPCHGALFDLDGSVLGGPTPIPLATRPAVVEAAGIRVGPAAAGR